MAAGSMDDDDAGGLRRVRATLIEQFTSTGDLVRALLDGPSTVLDLVPAGAAALHLDGVTSTVGDAPQIARIDQVVERLRTERRRLPVSTDSLAAEHPRLAALLPAVAGLLIVPIDGGRGYLAWFRRPLATPDGADVPGRAEPWAGFDAAAAQFSRDLDGAILRNLHADLARFGFHDALTGLSNKRLLMDRIEQALAGPSRGAGVALLLIEMNAFTAVNGALGHGRGDDLLIQAAGRLRTVTRDSDTVARLDGAAFAVLAGGADRIVAFRIAERVLTVFERPFALDGSQVKATVSIGGSEAESEDDAAELLQRAQSAVEWAKDFGKTGQAVGGLSQPPSKAAFRTGQRIEGF